MTGSPRTSVPLAFVDCETTGLDPDRHEVWEVAVIRREADGTEELWRALVEIDDLATADAAALNVGRFFDRYQDSKASNRAGVAKEVMRRTWGAHLVGAVPSFDAAFLGRLLRWFGCVPGWHYHLIDVEALAAGVILANASDRDEIGRSARATALPPWNSAVLSRAVGIDPDMYDRHTALGDAMWARDLYDAVLEAGL